MRELDVSQAFYERHLGLACSAHRRGISLAIWIHATAVQAIRDARLADGTTIVSPRSRALLVARSPSPMPEGDQVTPHDGS